jgi:FAD/FMN-containing dehydrogenase
MLSLSPEAFDIEGRVIAPHDRDYDDVRTVFLGDIDRRPALIARPVDAADVARVIAVARDAGAELAVRGGGHSAAGHSASEGGIVLDLRDLRALEIDAEQRTAWAQTGLTAGEYTTAAGEHGLATGFGDAGPVGIGGITLAGGLGFLARKHGLTIDHLLAAEIVTADGSVLHVDAAHHPELFWAIRGGGGNFGVVTRLQFRLYDVSAFTGGELVLPATPEVIEGFVAAAEAAPEALSTVANVMPAPPLPFLEPEHHGKLVVMATMAWTGDVEAGEQALAPFRALAEPVADLVAPKRYADMYPPLPPGYRPIAVGHAGFTSAVDGLTVIEGLGASTAMMRVVQLRTLGGAVARVPADATAFAHRDARVMVNVGAIYGDPAERPEHAAWVGALAGKLLDAEGVYVGFLGDEGEERIRAAYPGATYDRLAAVKAEYDPGNLFRLNQNVAPAA